MFHAIVIFITLANFQRYAARSVGVEGGAIGGVFFSLTAEGVIDRVMSVLGPNIVFDIVDKPTKAAFDSYAGPIQYASAVIPVTGLFQDRIEIVYGNFLIVSVYSGALVNEVYTVDASGAVDAVYGNIQNGDYHDQTIRNARGLRKFTFLVNPDEGAYLTDHVTRGPTKIVELVP